MQYKIDYRKASLREFAYEGAVSAAVAAIVVKLCRVPVPGSSDEPPVESLAGLEIAKDELPGEIWSAFEPLARELEELGFRAPVVHALKHELSSTQYYWMSFSHASGNSIARIVYRHWSYARPARTYLYTKIATPFTDGSWLVTTGGKPDMLAPRQLSELRIVGAKPSVLWQAHITELTGRHGGKSVIPTTGEQLKPLLELLHATVRDFNLQRGVFKQPTAKDQKAQEELEQSRKSAANAGSLHPEVHAALEQLHRKQTSWGSALLLLIVSIAFFLGAGAARWDWKFALLLIPVLLFHELGHYLAMRLFNYRNLKMFFIPFFGAAVSGHNYNVPGWKKVIVSLAGPVPGIVLGILLGAVGAHFQIDWLVKFSTLLVVLNGFNLLPVLPLDGGWIVHALFFSRHYLLDFLFRFLAVGGLLAWGMFGGDKIMLYLGIAMGVGLPVSFKIARISGKLKKMPLPQTSPDYQEIPHLTAETIISEVKAAFPKLNPKLAAENTLAIFENLNARPPGLVATLFWSVFHFGTLVVAFFAWGFLGLAQIEAGQMPRSFPLNCAEISAPDSLVISNRFTLVATYNTPEEAQKGKQELAVLAGAEGQVRLLGQTVLAGFSSDEMRQAIIAKAEETATNLFVQFTNSTGTSFSLTCTAPDEHTAKKIADTVTAYLNLPAGSFAAPPWSAHFQPQEDFVEVRQAYAHLLSANLHTDEKLRELSTKKQRAAKLGDLAQVSKLEAEEGVLIKTLQKAAAEAVAATNEPAAKLLPAYLELLAAGEEEEALQSAELKLGESFGQMTLVDGQPTWEEASLRTSWGYVVTSGREVRFMMFSFPHPFHGPPALVTWLCSQNFSEFEYSFHGGYSY